MLGLMIVSAAILAIIGAAVWATHDFRLPAFFKLSDAVAGGTQEIINEALANFQETLDKARSIEDYRLEIEQLQTQVSTLKIARDQKLEEFQKREREIEHKLGLHRKQTASERAIAVKEAKLAVREENLAAARDQFEERMSFYKSHMDKSNDYLKGIVSDLAKMNRRADVVIDQG